MTYLMFNSFSKLTPRASDCRTDLQAFVAGVFLFPWRRVLAMLAIASGYRTAALQSAALCGRLRSAAAEHGEGSQAASRSPEHSASASGSSDDWRS